MIKLSISNIAWPHLEDDHYMDYISGEGFNGIEIAPSRIWGDFRIISSAERIKFLKSVNSYGLELCSMHSLYYGQVGMSIFGDQDEAGRFISYTKCLVELAYDLEIPRIVLGSPAIRDRRGLSFEVAIERAAAILAPLAEFAKNSGVKILIEALAKEETNFINTHEEALLLVDTINSNGFGLHLDAKAISSEKKDLSSIIKDCGERIEHFHVNELNLDGFEEPQLDHKVMADSLKKIGYRGYASIEMKQLPDYSRAIKTAVKFVRDNYGL